MASREAVAWRCEGWTEGAARDGHLVKMKGLISDMTDKPESEGCRKEATCEAHDCGSDLWKFSQEGCDDATCLDEVICETGVDGDGHPIAKAKVPSASASKRPSVHRQAVLSTIRLARTRAAATKRAATATDSSVRRRRHWRAKPRTARPQSRTDQGLGE